MRAALAAALAATALAGDTVFIKPGSGYPSTRVREDHCSFSYEVSCVSAMLGIRGEKPIVRQSFVNLMSLLRGGSSRGPNLRIGGNSADESAFVPASLPLPANDSYRITPEDFTLYAAAIPLWNGTATLGLNMRQGDNTSLAVAHVIGVIDTGVPWSLIDGLEIGNEVDLFSSNGLRLPNYTRFEYEAEFSHYVTDLHDAAVLQARMPYLRIQAATFCCNHSDFDLVIPGQVQSHALNISSVSLHYYPLSVCEGQTWTAAQLLSDTASRGGAEQLGALAATVRSQGVPLYIGEGNSVSCGGQEGLSNTFAATLWAADALLAFASVNITRFNFHGCPGGAYTAIAYSNTSNIADAPDVRPLFYALWMVSQAAQGEPSVLPASVSSSNPAIKAWVLGQEGAASLHVILLHKGLDSTADASVTLTWPGTARAPATLRRLAHASGGVNATSRISFGGLTLDGSADGVPVGTPTNETVAPSSSGTYTFTLPPISAALLTVPMA